MDFEFSLRTTRKWSGQARFKEQLARLYLLKFTRDKFFYVYLLFYVEFHEFLHLYLYREKMKGCRNENLIELLTQKVNTELLINDVWLLLNLYDLAETTL